MKPRIKWSATTKHWFPTAYRFGGTWWDANAVGRFSRWVDVLNVLNSKPI